MGNFRLNLLRIMLLSPDYKRKIRWIFYFTIQILVLLLVRNLSLSSYKNSNVSLKVKECDTPWIYLLSDFNCQFDSILSSVEISLHNGIPGYYKYSIFNLNISLWISISTSLFCCLWESQTFHLYFNTQQCQLCWSNVEKFELWQ